MIAQEVSRNNIILMLDPQSQLKFRVSSVWLDWAQKGKGESQKKQVAVICLWNLQHCVEVVHPLTNFILSNWRYHTYNTQRKHALNTVKYLNYLLNNKRQFKLSSLSELEIWHGEHFLNEMTQSDKTRDTVKDLERTLIKFYLFLSNENCLPRIPREKFSTYKNINGKDIYISPFTDAIFPSKSVSAIEHTFPEKYLPLLFEVAILVARPIVLGLYLQIFGGLRVGEVVNIKRSSLKHQINGESLLIKIKEQYLRTDLKDSSGANYVKKPREQKVFLIKDWLETLYQDHVELYKSSDGSGALFVNRDGKAMSGRSYRQYFDKTKKYFINILRESPDINDKLLAHHLSIVKWSTHIGRGIFSNMLATYAKNPYEIAVPRGDDSLLSSLKYLKKTDRMRMKLEERIQSMHETYVPRLIGRKIQNDKEV